jgi:hypothetical protein
MSSLEKVIHKLFLSLVFTIINWIVIDHFIVELSFIKYIFVEVLLLFSMKFYIFTTRKLNL